MPSETEDTIQIIINRRGRRLTKFRRLDHKYITPPQEFAEVAYHLMRMVKELLTEIQVLESLRKEPQDVERPH